MKGAIYGLLLLIFLGFASRVIAADFKPYPGATIDQKATKDATEMIKQAGMKGKSTIYTTNDSFEKVVAFYKGIAKEWQMHKKTWKLRSGGAAKDTYFIFDGAKDITTSNLWIKIQRPYIGWMKANAQLTSEYVEDVFDDIRDVTAIVVSEHQ